MKQNFLLGITQTLKNIFYKETPGVSLSTEDARATVDPRQEILEEIVASQRKSGVVSKDHLKVLAAVFYQVNLEGSYYRLKDFNRYGQCFELESIKMVLSKTPDGKHTLDDLLLHFVDSNLSSGTSAAFIVSVKDLDEWMSPVIFPTLDKP